MKLLLLVKNSPYHSIQLQEDSLQIKKKFKISYRESTFQNELFSFIEKRRRGDEIFLSSLNNLNLNLDNLFKLFQRVIEKSITIQFLEEGLTVKPNDKIDSDFFVSIIVDYINKKEWHKSQLRKNILKSKGIAGRPRALDEKEILRAIREYQKGKQTVQELCNKLGISRNTFYRYKRMHDK